MIAFVPFILLIWVIVFDDPLQNEVGRGEEGKKREGEEKKEEEEQKMKKEK